MNIDKEREAFEANERTRHGYGVDTLTRYISNPDEYALPLTQARWEGYQAGRAAGIHDGRAAAYDSASRMDQMREDGL